MKTARVAAVVSIAALTLVGCGERAKDDDAKGDPTSSATATTTGPPAKQYPDFKACMVSDSGGFDDKSFNQTSHDGLVAAKDTFGVQTSEAESKADSDYANNLKSLATDAKCNEITTVGFLLGEATLAAAKANPNIDYAIVDFAYFDDKGNNTAPKNVKGLTFNTDEPSYLAGYLAASQSESGIVGTFGGAKIPTVTIFMDGFAKGVAKFNEDKGADVKVIGWDADKQEGQFTDDFENKAKGQSLAEAQIKQGADIIFPVAGPAGLGGLQAAKDGGVKAIWVDTDGYESASEYGDILLTSVVKGMDVAVTEAIKASAEGTFSNELYVGTLENGGVGLAPYHDFEDSIDQETKDEVEALKAAIISGEITLK